MTPHILLACRQDAGAATARKWHWEPATLKINNRPTFIDPNGEAVVCVSSVEHLRGIKPDTKIYLGEAWIFAFGGSVKDALRDHVAKGGALVAAHWKAGQVTFGPPPYDI